MPKAIDRIPCCGLPLGMLAGRQPNLLERTAQVAAPQSAAENKSFGVKQPVQNSSLRTPMSQQASISRDAAVGNLVVVAVFFCQNAIGWQGSELQ